MGDRRIPFREILIPALLMVTLLCATLLETNVGLGAENSRLAERVAELEGYIRMQSYVGGAEIGSYRFPIHPDDYLLPSSPFGERESPFTGKEAYHLGVDLVGVWNARIQAVADGVVEVTWPAPGTPVPWKKGAVFSGHPLYGGMIEIRHDDGSKSRYGHLSKTLVWKGNRVVAGQVIGRQGNTGKTTGKQHLHFELEVGGRLVNPLLWIGEAE